MKAILITSSILILLIAALRPLLRGRIDPRIQYALWLTVALRLLIPGNLFTSAYSALALLERADRGPGIVETIGQTPIPAQSYDNARAQVVEEYRRQGVPEAQLTPSDLMAIDTQARELMRGPTLAELAAKCARPLWLGGAAAMALWFGAVNWKLRRRLRGAQRIEADCPLPVYVTDALPSPCLCGALRPRIYVTPAALDGPDRLRHVLAHELTHYRHKDHWWALVRCTCLCLYWFDPLVWWAAALSRQDCELACDEGAIRALGKEERIPYGRTLVGLIAAGRTPLLQTATTMTGGKRRVRERVKLIARRPKTVIALALAAALLVGCAVGCTFSGAPEGGKPISATADSLQARLQDIPEELRTEVVIRPYEQAEDGEFLVHYWINRDWTDLDNNGLGWLLGVRRMSQAELDEYRATGGFEVFAYSGDTYYAIAYATDVHFYSPDDAEPFHSVFDAIRAFAEKTVLETAGVEPLAPRADTLPERLRALPAELRDSVEASVSETKTPINDIALASYWWDVPAEWESERSAWLLSVHRWEKAAVGAPANGSVGDEMEQFFAQDGEYYYAIRRPLDKRFHMEDAEPFIAAYNTVCAFAQKAVLETAGVEPYSPDQAAAPQPDIQSVVDRLMAAPSLTLTYTPSGLTSHVYTYTTHPGEDNYINRLADLAADFRWEDAGYSGSPETGSLQIASEDGAISLILLDGSYLVLDGDGHCWKGIYKDASLIEPFGDEDITPFEYLRHWWFDLVEVRNLRVFSVPDRGQSHEDIAREWALSYESALTKAAPGGQFSCTFLRVDNVQADLPQGLTLEELKSLVESRNFSFAAEDFGKLWFGFSYELVFVPENQMAREYMMAGNTSDYEGGDAPEGAMTYSRRGFLWRTDQGWTCREVGTGW